MDNNERLADLQRQLADARRSPGPFKAGFSGCFGVLAAIVLLIVAVGSLSQCGSSDREGSLLAGTADPDAYLSHCAAAGVTAKYAQRRPGLEYRIGEDPVITAPGPPPQVACPFTDRRGRAVTVTIEIRCANVMEPSCAPIQTILD